MKIQSKGLLPMHHCFKLLYVENARFIVLNMHEILKQIPPKYQIVLFFGEISHPVSETLPLEEPSGRL